MGAWEYGLFEGDNDYDTAADLDHELGVFDLDKKHVDEAIDKVINEKVAQGGSKQLTDEEQEKIADSIRYTIHADGCSKIEAVREYLETSGALDRVVAKHIAAFKAAKSIEIWYGPEYKLVVLAACAMSLGCKLPPDFRKLVSKLYPYVGLMDKGRKQMEEALNRYRDGDPFDFGSSGLLETANENADQREEAGPEGFVGMNVFGVGTLFGKPPAPPTHPEDVCGTCGTKAEEGKTLLLCAKCKKTKYCDKDCQKIYWGTLKKRCKAADS